MANIFRQTVALRGGSHSQFEESLSEVFHENTKLRRATTERPAGPDEYRVSELEAMARAYKRYRLRPQVPLPRIQMDLGAPIGEVLAARRSKRNFAARSLGLPALATLLQWSYGITGEARIAGGGVQHFRAAPSAGALYPAEMYLGVRAVQGLEAGVYHYEVAKSSLALLSRGDPTERLCNICGQAYPREAAVVVLISAVVDRVKRKYGERGYRYILLDIGHLAENLYLACTALGLAIVTTGAFIDDEAADLLAIDGCDEAVFYLAFVGPDAN